MIVNRKKNAIYGTAFGIVLKLIQIAFPFIIRTIFIRSLGVDYLGLNSLFTAILQVLNLAELGVSSALVFSMYKPIADNNSEKICQLMNLYKRYYRLIGTVVLFAGLTLIPFLPKLISGAVPTNINLYIIYTMNLTATVLSYWLFSYRNSLLVAHQRNDVISIITIIVYLCQYGLQIVTLLVLKNYYFYLLITILGQIVINIVTALVAKYFYPDYNPTGSVSEYEKKEINKKVKYLFIAKIGGVVNNSADSIVISAILGLKLLAIYQNYYYIISAIMAIFNIFFTSCVAGIGNSLIVNDVKQNVKLLYNINHIVFIAINVCCACFISVCQTFMNIWVGKEYTLDFSIVFLFSLYLFVEEIPRTLIVFKDAGGIWKHDRYRPLIAAFVNLCLNLILTNFIGLYGILISTIVALAFIAYPWLIININKRLFNINIKKYLIRLILYIIICCSCSMIAYIISLVVTFESIFITIVFRLIIVGMLSFVVPILAFNRTEENKYLIAQFSIIKRKLLNNK